MITLHTTKGDISIELDEINAPISSKNFLDYAQSGFFDGLIFHRVIKDFMIQGGGMDANMSPKSSNAPITNEANNGLQNDKYTVAMARTSDPHSASSQFFINTNNNLFLDYPGQDGWGYAVFGKVTQGFEVVDAIEAVTTTNQAGHADVPTQAITITSVSIR